MIDTFPDRLLDAIDRAGAPVCVGIDPVIDQLPPQVLKKIDPRLDEHEAAIDAIFDFVTTLLRVVAPLVPAVKFQSAYFEKYHWEGVEAYYSLIQEARDLGLIVIGDVKRGDIGTTAQAYAAGHLAELTVEGVEEVVLADAITVNPMLGMDTLEPFVKTANEHGKGVFVLVRTSNPGSAALQDIALPDGRTWSEMLADTLHQQVASAPACIGRRGYSSVGAVIGATQPHTMQSLRKRLPQSIFLLPGYGAQGATAEMTRAAFIDGRGAIVSASRSVNYAFSQEPYASKFPNQWEKAVEAAVLDMKHDLKRVLESRQ